eukprot:c20787_g10_i12.p1 GENE.c20787_g10_i12~~c20787_g10_i12.p1  ORF type:complete len:376 (+),score=42.88 c20787_g10_i12:36-1163(+)
MSLAEGVLGAFLRCEQLQSLGTEQSNSGPTEHFQRRLDGKVIAVKVVQMSSWCVVLVMTDDQLLTERFPLSPSPQSVQDPEWQQILTTYIYPLVSAACTPPPPSPAQLWVRKQSPPLTLPRIWDAAVVVAHITLIQRCSFRLISANDTPAQAETLPANWNILDSVPRALVSLRYLSSVTNTEFVFAAAIVSEKCMLMHLMSCSTNALLGSTELTDQHLVLDSPSPDSVFSPKPQSAIQELVLTKLCANLPTQPTPSSSSQPPQRSDRSERNTPPSHGPPYRPDPSFPNSLPHPMSWVPRRGGIGEGDLDPFFVPGGGLVGPNHPVFGTDPSTVLNPRFPGQIPGARIYPTHPGQLGREPDPDHERRPDADKDFPL